MHKAAAHAKRGLPLRHLPAMDLPFLVLVLTLVGFGLVMLGSASSAVALYRRGDAFAYLRPQLLYAALGIGAMWVASRVDYHIYHKLAWPLLALSMVLLTAVLFMPEYNGCKRWLVLPGLGTLQPSEIAKFAVVLVFAHIIALNHDRMGSFAVGGAALCTGAGSGGGAHAAGTAPLRHRAHFGHRCGAHVRGRHRPQVVRAGRGGRCSGHWSCHHHYAGPCALRGQPSQLMAGSLCRSAGRRPPDHPEPVCHRLRGAAGLGLGSSRQKHLFVPEPQNDFIFSILCEELGFVGACAVILLFALLLWRGITLAAHAPDRFGALLVVGFVVQVALQAVLNMAVVTNTIPNTGISLPFFSPAAPV